MESSEQYSCCNFSRYSSHTLPNLFQFLAPEQLTLQVGKCIPMLGSPRAWGLLTKWDSKPAASASLWRQSAGEPWLASEPSALFWSLHPSGPHSGFVTHFLLLPCLRDLPHPLEISVASILQRSTHIPPAPFSRSPLILPMTTLPHLCSCTSLVLIIHIIKCLHKLSWNISLPFHRY